MEAKTLSFVLLVGCLAFRHIKHTVNDAFNSVKERCVSETVKDGKEIFKFLSSFFVIFQVF